LQPPGDVEVLDIEIAQYSGHLIAPLLREYEATLQS